MDACVHIPHSNLGNTIMHVSGLWTGHPHVSAIDPRLLVRLNVSPYWEAILSPPCTVTLTSDRI